MAGSSEGRTTRLLRPLFWWIMAAAVIVLGAIGALMLSAGQASAQTITFPGIGAIDIPGEVATPGAMPGALTAIPEDVAPAAVSQAQQIGAPEAIPGTLADAVPADVQAAVEALVPGFDFRSLPQLPGLAPRPEPSAPAATPEKSHGQLAVEAAESKLGSSYAFGSAGPDSFDCSGLVQWSYEQAGVELPRTSYEQLDAGTPVGLDELQPGDLVSFYGGDHSALYAGDGQVIHAATSGTGVVMSPITEMPVTGARRF